MMASKPVINRALVFSSGKAFFHELTVCFGPVCPGISRWRRQVNVRLPTPAALCKTQSVVVAKDSRGSRAAGQGMTVSPAASVLP
jgi:hypothetical protein